MLLPGMFRPLWRDRNKATGLHQLTLPVPMKLFSASWVHESARDALKKAEMGQNPVQFGTKIGYLGPGGSKSNSEGI